MARHSASFIPRDVSVDLLVVGAGTGLAAALAGHEAGLDTLVIEKTSFVGGSTALSGGGLWIPLNPVLERDGAVDTPERAAAYLDAIVGDAASPARRAAYLASGAATIAMLERTTPLRLAWCQNYSDYHPEEPGGSAAGRGCESGPVNLGVLGARRKDLRPTGMAAPVPMPVTAIDYRRINLMMKTPASSMPRVLLRVMQGVGGKALGRDYAAGGQALAGGLFAGVLHAGVPIWMSAALASLIVEDDRVVGAVVTAGTRTVTVRARKGVVLAAGGFDHDLELRRRYQSPALQPGWSHGCEANTGEVLGMATDAGADLHLMDQAWWFPSVAPLPGGAPKVMLAERSLPGSFMIDGSGRRFVNEAADYMSVGQQIAARQRAGDGPDPMWIVFDQAYRNSYLFAAELFPRQPIPREWYDSGIAVTGANPDELASAAGVNVEAFKDTIARFNVLAAAGEDDDFGRGRSAYDRYYGDPTNLPNPCLRPLAGRLFAVRVVLGDLGTCGGVRADENGQALRPDGRPIEGLYAIGNTAGNAFGHAYPGPGGTIGQGLVFGYRAARHAAGGVDCLT